MGRVKRVADSFRAAGIKAVRYYDCSECGNELIVVRAGQAHYTHIAGCVHYAATTQNPAMLWTDDIVDVAIKHNHVYDFFSYDINFLSAYRKRLAWG